MNECVFIITFFYIVSSNYSISVYKFEIKRNLAGYIMYNRLQHMQKWFWNKSSVQKFPIFSFQIAVERQDSGNCEGTLLPKSQPSSGRSQSCWYKRTHDWKIEKRSKKKVSLWISSAALSDTSFGSINNWGRGCKSSASVLTLLTRPSASHPALSRLWPGLLMNGVHLHNKRSRYRGLKR